MNNTSVPMSVPPFTHTHTTTTSTPSTSKTTTTQVISNPNGRPTTTKFRTVTSTTPSHTSTHTPPNLVPSSDRNSGGGLSQGGTIAIAVVVPVVVVALLVLLGIFCWRRRRQRKVDREARRKEVEEYGYNPNNDPTLPAVGGIAGSDSPEMSEDTSGYRGWGNTNGNGTSTTRKASTNLSSGMGMPVSDDGRNRSPGSPGQSNAEGDPFVDGPAGTATGAAVASGVTHRTSRGGANGAGGVQRGPSNASSTYSAAGRTDDSGDILGAQQDYSYGNNYSSYNPAQGAFGDGGQPVIRDVNARRNTKIENAVYPQQGNSGIAQNF